MILLSVHIQVGEFAYNTKLTGNTYFGFQDQSGKGRLRDGHDSSGKTNYLLENSCLTNLNFVRTCSTGVNA